ncbi:MAG: hypothetical protein FWE61_03820 [Micrococcales bacterium]|nr:hypothetical protein [Micrococcales bacterium]
MDLDLLRPGGAPLEVWLPEPAGHTRVRPFAQANGSGSLYALWDDGTGADPEDWPVIVFGDEGGVYLVAAHLRNLLQLLALDTEISVDFDAHFYLDPDDEWHTRDHDLFVTWLADEFGLAPATDPGAIVAATRDRYRVPFAAWLEAAGYVE